MCGSGCAAACRRADAAAQGERLCEARVARGAGHAPTDTAPFAAAAASMLALYESGSIESEWPPSNQQMAPALPPVSTAPRCIASRSSASTPSRTQRSTAKSVLPPLTMMTSAAATDEASCALSGATPTSSNARTAQPASSKRAVCR